MRPTLVLSLLSIPLAAQVAPPNGMGVSMGHVHIITPQPEAQKKIWIDALGGKLVTAGPLEYAMFPGVLVGFRKGESSGGTIGSVVNHLGFQVRDLRVVREKLRAAGVAVPEAAPGAHNLMATLPDGVEVEFIEKADLDVPIRHHHVHFATDRLEEMRAWYAKVFGAVPGMRGEIKAADLPGVNLSWNSSTQPTLPTKGRALDHIGFEVSDIKAFCARLEAAGLKLDMPPTPRPDLGLVIAFLTDPWGTRVELTEGLKRF